MKKKLSSSFRQNPSRPVGCYFEQVFQLLELLLGGGHPDFGRLQGPLVGVEQRRLLQLLQVESEAEKTFLLKKKKKQKEKKKVVPFSTTHVTQATTTTSSMAASRAVQKFR